MNEDIRVELVKLVGGERLLRLEHLSSGLCLEKRLGSKAAVVVYTKKLRRAFVSLLAHELLAI